MSNRLALAEAQEWAFRQPGVTGVYYGLHYTDGQRTGTEGVVVTVKRKQPLSQIRGSEMVPRSFAGIATDVVETGPLEILSLRPRQPGTFSLTQRRRPCEGGYSIGHRNITAGTLGMWARRVTTGEWVLVSNNHVLADSNGATRGDFIIQPGKADQGTYPADAFARLTDFVPITFERSGKKGSQASQFGSAMWWQAFRAASAGGAKLVGCDYRLPPPERSAAEMLQDAGANTLDLAIARPTNDSWVKPIISHIGEVTGWRNAELNLDCQKTGRTTERQWGYVEGLEGSFRVSYGNSGTALFQKQLVIRKRGGGEFSAGGDSGSVILDNECRAIGLLFAGGDGLTIANPIEDVMQAFGGLQIG